MPCTFAARVLSPGFGVEETEEATATADVVTAFWSLLQVVVEEKALEARPGEVLVYNVTVRNFGNSGARVAFHLVEGPADGWAVTLPADLVLESPTREGAQAEAVVRLLVEPAVRKGWNNDQAPLTLEVVASSLEDEGAAADPVRVHLLASVRGRDGASAEATVPAPTPLAVLLALALVALRRRT
ncbi:MAG TPA: hypothetical protein VFH47_03100 [Candidatus Thermoplasmatota archaeon]|nr:hypothetical protein [Candidatus Thermoplasmatota archaeon]